MAPNEYPESEGMQVVPPHEGLQVIPQQQGLEVVPSQGLESIEKKNDDTAYQGIEVANEPVQSIKFGKPRYKTVCGLRYRIFAIVIAILVAVIVAAVVGGVVGSRKSKSNDSSPDSSASTSTGSSPTKTGSHTTTAPHSTPSSDSTPSTVANGPVPTTPLKLNCPAINNTIRSVKSDGTGIVYPFDIYCNANWAPGYDLGIRNTTSFDDCIQVCISLSDTSVKGGPCLGAVWDSIMNLNLDGQKRNCFLKNGTANETDMGYRPSFDEYPSTHPAAAIFVPNSGT